MRGRKKVFVHVKGVIEEFFTKKLQGSLRKYNCGQLTVWKIQKGCKNMFDCAANKRMENKK